jgi:hypothetical protein
VISDDDWASVCFFIDQGWGDFDQDRRDAYRFFLGELEQDELLAGLKKLAEDGQKFLPRPPEIITAVRSLQEPPVPSWSEAWAVLRKAMEARSEERAYELLNGVHLVLGKFMEAEGGWEAMRLQPFFDPEFGMVRVRDLKARWEEFVEVARERLRQGFALEAASGRRHLGPRTLGTAALVEKLRPASELESGE